MNLIAHNTRWLVDDVNQNKAALEQHDSQLARRNYMRSLAAMYEADLSHLRERAAKYFLDEFDLTGQWRIHELYPLLDENARISGNGKLELETNRLSFLPLAAYTLKIYGNQVGLAKDILSDNRWHDFSQTIKIRNRITHPKRNADIDIADEELRSIDAGLVWWNGLMQELIKLDQSKRSGSRIVE